MAISRTFIPATHDKVSTKYLITAVPTVAAKAIATVIAAIPKAPSIATHRSTPQPNPATARHTISVLTYNILAEKYAASHSYTLPQHLAWNYRRDLLQDELRASDTDIVMLQEVQRNAFTYELQPFFDTRGFQGVYTPRQHGPTVKGHPEGIALFYRSSLFQLLDKHVLQLGELGLVPGMPAVPKPPKRSKHSQHGQDLWSTWRLRQEVALITLLLHKPSQRQLMAAATHLFWNPRHADVKALQALVLRHGLQEYMQAKCKTLDVPLIVGGDFNSLWHEEMDVESSFSDSDTEVQDTALQNASQGSPVGSGAYQIMQGQPLLPQHCDHPHTRRPPSEVAHAQFRGVTLEPGQLSLSSMHLTAHGREPLMTTRTDQFSGCLDYLFLSPHFEVEETLALPYDDTTSAGYWDLSAIAFEPIPNKLYPSDHLAVGGRLNF